MGSGSGYGDTIRAVEGLAALAAELDPDAIPDQQVEPFLAALARATKLVEGMTTLVARRLADVHGDARERLAASLGTTTRAAEDRIDTSQTLTAHHVVADAVRDGRLSREQTAAVATAAEADPTCTASVLEAADVQPLPQLRRTCREVVQSADSDRAATRRRHHAHRAFTSWQEPDGEWHARLRAPADIGARIEAALRPAHDARFRAAHAAGRREADAAYRLDALVDLLDRPATAGGSSRSGRQAKVIAVVDATALKRGRLAGGESCRIHGVGEVALEAVTELLPDAHVAYVIRDAVAVAVAHLGRQVTAHQRTALEARGYRCEVPGCSVEHLLEIDHVRDWAHTKQTRIADLAWLCREHHRAKTVHGWRITGPPGDRSWHPPTGRPPPPTPPAADRRHTIGQLSLA